MFFARLTNFSVPIAVPQAVNDYCGLKSHGPWFDELFLGVHKYRNRDVRGDGIRVTFLVFTVLYF